MVTEPDLLRRLVEASPDGILVVQDRLYRYDSQGPDRSPADNRIGLSFAYRAPPEQQPGIWSTLDAVQSGELPGARIEWESVVTGHVLEAILRPMSYEGAPAVAAFLRDVTERVRLAEAKEEQARVLAETVEELSLYQRMFELSRDSIVIVQDGVVQLSNGALRGQGAPSIVGQRVDQLFDADTMSRIRQDAQRLLGGAIEQVLWEWPVPGADPGMPDRTVEAIGRRIDYLGRPALLINTRDVTERKAVEVRLQEMTRTDSLTASRTGARSTRPSHTGATRPTGARHGTRCATSTSTGSRR